MLKLIMLLLRHVKASLTPQEVSVIKRLLIQAGMQPPVLPSPTATVVVDPTWDPLA